MRNIVLIGIMGCGKTTLGKLAAARCGRLFVDMDEEIEKETGLSINDIFEQRGEPAFRDLETDMARRLGAKGGLVIATGGGAVLREDNMAALGENGTIVFLDRPVEDILKQIRMDDRPLLKAGKERLLSLYKKRLPLYRSYARYTLENTGREEDAVRALTNLMTQDGGDSLSLAVIGDPIEHSLSPDIHLPILHQFGLGQSYQKIQVAKGDLPAFLKQAKAEHLDGFNLTMPHKLDILPLLDEIDPTAALLGSVNTVVCQNGRMTGYNTDAAGFYLALARLSFSPQQENLVILGAGGAARALAMQGALSGAQKITLLGRTPSGVEALAARLAEQIPTLRVATGALTPADMATACEDAGLLVNTTPKGMAGSGQPDWEDLSFLSALPKKAVVADIIYHPGKTRLLEAAEKIGLHAQNGLWMLIYQAILADEKFLMRPLLRNQAAEQIYNLFTFSL